MTYTVEIRNTRGSLLATGHGHTDWERTATRLAAEEGLACRSHQLVDTYFPTDLGAPYGIHHVQWGFTPRGGSGLSLGLLFVVNVQPQ